MTPPITIPKQKPVNPAPLISPSCCPVKPNSDPQLARIPPRIAAPASAVLPPPQEVGQPIPTGQVFGEKNSNARVVLRARAAAHVLVQSFGGKVYINRLLHPGDVYRVPNLAGLSLTTPDGGAVGLELDGQDAGAAGPPGQTTEALSLDPRAIADRHGGIRNESNKVTQ